MTLGASEEDVHAALWPAVRYGLLERLPGTYRFIHDRVQEAVYSLIAVESRAAVHLRIGRLLVSHTPPEKQQDAIFELVNQFDRALELLTSREERQRVAELNLAAARRAKSSSAYASALTYLTVGAELLGDRGWDTRRDLTFALELERAGCEFLLGEVAAADDRLTELANYAANPVERAGVACLHMDVCMTSDQMARAVEVALECLRHAGVHWSSHPTEQEARAEYQRTWSLIGGRDIDELIALPVTGEPAIMATLDVLERGLTPALFTDANLLSVLICGLANLSLEHGLSAASCTGFIWLGMIAGTRFGDYTAGFRFGQLGYDLVQVRALKRFKALTYLSFGVYIVPWTKHVRNAEALIRRAFESAIAIGDLTTATSCGVDLFGNLLAAGAPLEDVQREAEQSLEFARKTGPSLWTDIGATQLALVRSLRDSATTFGCLDHAQFDEREMERRLSRDEGPAIAACWYWVRKLQARFFAGEFATAVSASLNAQRLLWTSPCFLETADAHFYGALSHAAVCDAAVVTQCSAHIDAVAAHHRQLAEWAEHCPDNFENRASLVAAEIARLERRDVDAMRLYEQAIRSAHVNGFVHNEAVAWEVAARFYAARGFEKIPDAYVREAKSCYSRWGANGKVKQLDQLHPRLREAPGLSASAMGSPRVEQLDVETVVKASQALSSEMHLPKLIERLMRIATEDAGAERGLLLLLRGNEPSIEAEAMTASGRVEVAVRHAAVSSPDLPESVLHYVMRTKETVLLDDASSDRVYSKDRLLREKGSRSVLCLPIVNTQRLVGVLYLENGLAPFVFTPDRVTVLQVLASQAAISLENAALYTDLQLQVELLQRLPVSAWTLEPDGTPDFVNRVWLDFAGQTLEFVRSHPEAWMTAVHPEDRGRVAKQFWEGVHSGQSFSIEARSLRAVDGTYRWHLQQAVVLRDSAGKVMKFVGTTTDVDEQKRAEEALRQAQGDLARINRATTMGELAASLAHEISQPITGAMTTARVCLRKIGPEHQDIRPALARVVRDTQRAADIIGRLRAQFESGSLNREVIDLNTLLRETVALLHDEAVRHRVSVRTSLAADPVQIVGDRVQLQQVAMNLIINSIDAMKEVESAREIVIQSQQDRDGSVLVSVQDSGPGFVPALAERIFDPFFTTKPHGTGMGLRICRSIVESHGGRLWAVSSPGSGATFHMNLPGSIPGDR